MLLYFEIFSLYAFLNFYLKGKKFEQSLMCYCRTFSPKKAWEQAFELLFWDNVIHHFYLSCRTCCIKCKLEKRMGCLTLGPIPSLLIATGILCVVAAAAAVADLGTQNPAFKCSRSVVLSDC